VLNFFNIFSEVAFVDRQNLTQIGKLIGCDLR